MGMVTDAIGEIHDKEIEKLQAELSDYKSGHKGACPTCEPVGELNERLQAEKKLLRDCLELVDMYGSNNMPEGKQGLIRQCLKEIEK